MAIAAQCGMENPGSNSRLSPEAVKAIGAGSSFFGCSLGGFLLGRLFSFWLNIAIWPVIAGTLIGFVAGNWAVYKIFMESKKK